MQTRTCYIPSEKKILNIPKKVLFMICKRISRTKIRQKLESFTKIFDYEKSEYIAQMDCLTDGRPNIFKREWLFDTEYHDFEDIKVRIPKQYDSILRQLYGDYMVLPPETSRVAHHYYDIYEK